MAILMADLSGYTALTETHGASSAADLIDKYLNIVSDCLVGESRLHERTGDEVMIISPTADDLLATALTMLPKCLKEHHFLLIHGGMHYGEILLRNNSYFGTAINFTSRITSKAGPGSIWCSSHFVNAVSHKELSKFQSKGKHSFKNISEENEMFEVLMENINPFYVDPVCRMLILNKEKAIPHPSNPDMYFCSHGCLETFSGKIILVS